MSRKEVNPSPEHLEFMSQLVENTKEMIGEDRMVACIGNEQNGVYAILVSVHPLPPELVMMTIISMMIDQVVSDMGSRHNELMQAKMSVGSESVN